MEATESEFVGVRLPKLMAQELLEVAKQRGQSASELVREGIQLRLDTEVVSRERFPLLWEAFDKHWNHLTKNKNKEGIVGEFTMFVRDLRLDGLTNDDIERINDEDGGFHAIQFWFFKMRRRHQFVEVADIGTIPAPLPPRFKRKSK